VVEADTGVMGGSFSHEFMVPAPVGDDDIVYCDESGYSANREKATSAIVPPDLADAARPARSRNSPRGHRDHRGPRGGALRCRGPTNSSRPSSTWATASPSS